MAELLDFDQPIGLLAVAILHFIPDADDPWALLARFRDAVPPGSFLVLTHAADTPHTQQAAQTYERTTAGAATVRSEPSIRAMFDEFDLVDPGLVSITAWGPDTITKRHPASTEPAVLYGGVGRKPHPAGEGPAA